MCCDKVCCPHALINLVFASHSTLISRGAYNATALCEHAITRGIKQGAPCLSLCLQLPWIHFCVPISPMLR